MKTYLLSIVVFFSLALNAIYAEENPTNEQKKNQNLVKEKKASILNEYAKKTAQQNPELSLSYALEAYTNSKNTNDKKGECEALFNIGYAYKLLNNSLRAIDYFQQSGELSKNTDFKELTGKTYSNIASIYMEKGSYEIANEYNLNALTIRNELVKEFPDDPKYLKQHAITIYQSGQIFFYWGKLDVAFEKYKQALIIYEKINFMEGVAQCLNDEGIVFKTLTKYDEALNCYNQSIKIQTKLNNKIEIANTLNNIGNIYGMKGDNTKALSYFKRSLKLREEIGNEKILPDVLNNIGLYYQENKMYEQALDYFQRSLEIQQKFDMKEGIASSFNIIGKLYIDNNNILKGIDYCRKSLDIIDELNIPQQRMNVCLDLSEAYEKMKDYTKALEYYKLSTSAKEKLFNTESSERISEIESRYKLEKKETERKHMEEIIQIKIDRRNNIQYSSIFIGIIILFLGVFFSGKFVLPKWFAEAIVFFTIVMLFEFILVVLDPTIEKYSKGMPALKLASNITLALLIFPVHSFLEETLKKRALKRHLEKNAVVEN